MCFRKQCIPQVQSGLVHLFIKLNALQDFDESRISSVVIIIAYASSHYREKSIFLVFFYDWGPQYIVLVTSNFETTFKILHSYEFHLTQCLEKSGIIFNIDNIRIKR